jgi:hypothetical protein
MNATCRLCRTGLGRGRGNTAAVAGSSCPCRIPQLVKYQTSGVRQNCIRLANESAGTDSVFLPSIRLLTLQPPAKTQDTPVCCRPTYLFIKGMPCTAR